MWIDRRNIIPAAARLRIAAWCEVETREIARLRTSLRQFSMRAAVIIKRNIIITADFQFLGQ